MVTSVEIAFGYIVRQRLMYMIIFDLTSFFRRDRFLNLRAGKCDATTNVHVVLLHRVHSVVRVRFFFLLCFIIGDREFLTGGPAALRHTCCLLGRRMFFLLFFCLFIDYGVIKMAQDICPCYLSLHVKIKIISEY